MRTEKISYSVNGEDRSGVIRYPDLWCFVFNPNYIEFDYTDQNVNNVLTITFKAGTMSYDLDVYLLHGKASVYISKILQLFITDPEKVRNADVTISIKDGDTYVLVEKLYMFVVWGCIKVGEQFGKYGEFKWNGKDLSHIRNVVWFRNFPFYVSMFRSETGELTSGSYDGNEADANTRIFRFRISEVVEGELPKFATMSPALTNPSIVLNKTHGIIYAIDTENLSIGLASKFYNSWTSNGVYGNRWDYYDLETSEIRTDTEFEYNGEIVRWNKDTKELDTALMGNAQSYGLFELNPAISFPEAKNTAQYNICLEKVSSGIFDMNFNFVFPDTTQIVNETVNLIINYAKDGLYLRWIDCFGFIQYYLFREGTSTIKNKASSNTMQIERQFGGMYFGGMERTTEVTSTETIKCCAVNLKSNILEYVKTIVSAPIVELYLGRSKSGTELWLPVCISSGSYSTDPKTMLSDYEIVIEKTDNVSQTL